MTVCTYSVFTGLTEHYCITLTSVELTHLYHGAMYNFFVVALLFKILNLSRPMLRKLEFSGLLQSVE